MARTDLEDNELFFGSVADVYGEIGPGHRVALSKLAVEHFEKHGRPLRLAIDASIWEFQNQAGKGGSNPALRTLYYRLLRLISLSIQPLFIFDGPHKPPFKRNVKTGAHTVTLPNFVTKELLKFFGIPYHTAPGEAEAECALFQKEGIVDAVLSEDVDTMMFGCTAQIRNWSSETTRTSKVPTHVNLYDSETTKQGQSGLDSAGMILIALMSGGDYLPAGIPGCGIKIACQAAKAGFGRDLCRLDKTDTVGFNQWRERLEYELHVNESGIFRTKHKALAVPEKFPDKKVLGYYTNPTVSTAGQIVRLREDIKWNGNLDVTGLRQFVADAFEWKNISGAKKFVRGLAPAMLVNRLCKRYGTVRTDGDLESQEAEEKCLVTQILGRRTHFITDATPELRIAYTPIEIVDMDLGAEESDVEIIELSDSECEVHDEELRSRSRSPVKRAASKYDPAQPEKIWILETYAKFGAPLVVENWEEDLRNPVKFATRKARERTATARKTRKQGVMKPGAMNAYVKTMKPGVNRGKAVQFPEMDPSVSMAYSEAIDEGSTTTSPKKRPARKLLERDRAISPVLDRAMSSKGLKTHTNRTPTKPVSKDNNVNPWTLAKRLPESFSAKLRPGARYSALGIYEPPSTTPHSSHPGHVDDMDDSDVQELPPPPSIDFSMRQRASDAAQVEVPKLLRSRRHERSGSLTNPSPGSRPATPDTLPSPSTLISPLQRAGIPAMPPEETSPSKRMNRMGIAVQRTKALLALRESLDGAWREINPSGPVQPNVKKTFSQVEVVDLTDT
ncbi:MAG: hypothetical protein Q9212_005030 [Teloschistes hypoglaucus]